MNLDSAALQPISRRAQWRTLYGRGRTRNALYILRLYGNKPVASLNAKGPVNYAARKGCPVAQGDAISLNGFNLVNGNIHHANTGFEFQRG